MSISVKVLVLKHLSKQLEKENMLPNSILLCFNSAKSAYPPCPSEKQAVHS